MRSHCRQAKSALCVVACAALIALWIRSYGQADRLHGRFWGRQAFLLASKQGRVVAVAFGWHGAENWWHWAVRSYPVDDEMSFPVASVRQYESAAGFGAVRNPLYMMMRSTFETPEGATILISGAAVATLRGWGLIVPYWFLVLLAAVLGVASRLERPLRYTTRGLLVAVTFVAILLGLIVGLDHRPMPWTLDTPAPLDEL
jgi:hypothetical protein